MKQIPSAERLKKTMKAGRVYRRQDLSEFSSAVDRDLKTLIKTNQVSKLANGLYCRPQKNHLDAPPDDRALVRAFLKTRDFLLISHNGLMVYNHKRAGNFQLGGRPFKFRLVPAYPVRASQEYLLVDRLNNLRRFPDDAAAVLGNLKAGLKELDRDKVVRCLERYGSPAAKRELQEILK